MEHVHGDLVRRARIRTMNDVFRSSLLGGRVLLTNGIRSLGGPAVQQIVELVRKHDEFDASNDPYGEHDFGVLHYAGTKIFWKIDYYNKSLTAGSDDPTNEGLTERVLTIMTADEY